MFCLLEIRDGFLPSRKVFLPRKAEIGQKVISAGQKRQNRKRMLLFDKCVIFIEHIVRVFLCICLHNQLFKNVCTLMTLTPHRLPLMRHTFPVSTLYPQLKATICCLLN